MVVPRRGPGCFEQRKRANNKPPASRRLGSLMLGGARRGRPPVQHVSVKGLQSGDVTPWLLGHLSDAHQVPPHRRSNIVQDPGLRSTLWLMVIFIGAR